MLMIAAILPTSLFASGTVHTDTVDVAAIKKDYTGDGYRWENLYDILTLTNININTESAYGLKIPENATIVLKGDNYIKASEYAIHCLGRATFEGDGTLTLVSKTGMICASLHADDIVRFRSGNINITATDTAIYSENSTLTFTGSKVTTQAATHSVLAKKVLFTGGSFKGSAPITSKDSIEISAASVEINASAPAMTAVRGIKIGGCDLSVGASESDLTTATVYNGENSIKTVSNVKDVTKGVLFGGKLPAFVDYIAFGLLFLTVCALVAVPIIIKQRKTARLIAEYEKMKAERSKKRKK